MLHVGDVEDPITSVTAQSCKQDLCIEKERPRWEEQVVATRFMQQLIITRQNINPQVVESSGTLNHINVKILFDSGATDSFISPSALEKSGLVAYEHDDFKQVKMASGEKQVVGPSVDNCLVDLGVCTTRLKVYVTALGTYDLIIGMDWLEAHRAMVDCFTKRVLCVDDEGRPVEIHGVRRKVSLRFISTMKVKRCMRQGCRLYVVEAVNERKGPSLDQYPVLSEFKDVFPNELSGLYSERELDFTIELKPGAETISKTSYRMTAPKLCELQMSVERATRLRANKAQCLTLGCTNNFCEEEGWFLTTMYRLQGLESCYSKK
jgi:hypothetical protein